jgi:hypothetical protein
VVMATVFLTIRLQQIRLSEIDQTLLVTLDTLLRITMAAGFWRLTKLIQNSPAAGLFVWFEPYAFFLFCSHAVLFTFGGVILRRLLGEDGSELFPIVFFALPVLGVIGAVIGLQLINWSRVLLFLFNAGHKVPPLGLFQDARAREANPG